MKKSRGSKIPGWGWNDTSGQEKPKNLGISGTGGLGKMPSPQGVEANATAQGEPGEW